MKKTEISKADFIRNHGKLKAAEIVKAAAKEGMKISAKHVYVVRANDKKKAAKSKGKPAVTVARKGSLQRTGAGNGHSSNGHAASEQSFKALVLRIGLDRARATMASVEAQLGA